MAAAGGLRRSVGTTQLALGLLACGALNFEAVSADFTVDKFGVMSTLLDEVLRVPVTHSTLIQDGVESGMFYNHSTESIDIIDLHQLMFAQMRTLSPNYYHVWVGFEDASFLGYYQSGINTDLCSESAMSEDECEYYSISMQQGEGHACDYAYTHAQWTSGGSPGAEDATNFPDLPAVSDPCSGQNTACRTTLQMGCREYFMADQNRGLPDESFGGAPYDARKRGWYYSTKENVKKQFSGKYVDKAADQPSIAACAPLMSRGDDSPETLPDTSGVIGVACTGMQFEGLSAFVKDIWRPEDWGTNFAYVVDRSSRTILATSSSDRNQFFDYTAMQYITPSDSPTELVEWSAAVLYGDDDKYEDDEKTPMVPPFNMSTNIKGKTEPIEVKIYRKNETNYFLSLVEYTDSSDGGTSTLELDIIQVQEVACSDGYYPAEGTCLTCPEFHSSGYGDVKCEHCISGYFWNGKTCKRCDDGSSGSQTCHGASELPKCLPGYWIDMESVERLAEYDACFKCATPEQCIPADESLYDKCLQPTSDEFNDGVCSDAMCKDGATGKLCDVCLPDHFHGSDGCSPCASAGTSGGLGGFILAVLIFAVVFLVLAYFVAKPIYDYWEAKLALWLDVGKIKVLLVACQLISSVSASTGVVWPDPFYTVSNSIGSLQLNVFQVMPLECTGDYTYFSTVTGATLVPLGVAAALMLSVEIGERMFDKRTNSDKRHNYEIQIVIYMAYVLLPSTSRTLFKFLICQRFEDGSSWLMADYQIQCGTDSYNTQAVFVWFMIIIFPIGIPLIFLTLLYEVKEELKALDPDIKSDKKLTKLLSPKAARVKFLFASYNPKSWYAEVVECTRRLLLDGFVAVICQGGSNGAAGSLIGMMLAGCYCFSWREQMAFKVSTTNALALACQWQLFFTFFMAYVLSSGTFDMNGDERDARHALVAWLLCFLTVGLLGFGLHQQHLVSLEKQRIEAARLALIEENKKLALEMDNFRQSANNLVAVKQSMSIEVRRKFLFGDWASPPADMTSEERIAAAKGLELNTTGIQNDDELLRFLEVTKQAAEKGTTVTWYWEESEHRRESHDNLYLGKWVPYADSVAAQFEYYYAQGQLGFVEVDVKGRVTSKGSDHQNGTAYAADLAQMKQINVKTGFERDMLRVETAAAPSGAPMSQRKDTYMTQKNGMYVPDEDEEDEEDGDVLRRLGDDMPPFPADLIRSGDPVLLLKEGQLVQLQKKRDDGWAYGLVVYSPQENESAEQRRAAEVQALMDKLKTLQASEQAKAGGANGNAKIVPTGVDMAATKVDGQIDEEDLDGKFAGWLPVEFTRDPTPKEMKAMQDSMGGKDAIDALSPPSSWSSDPDPLNARVVPLQHGSDEYQKVTEAFRQTLDKGPGVLPNTRMSNGPPCPDLKIKGVSRIENLGLWQSYAAKKQSMLTRAKAEGVDSSNYEVEWSFHGCGPDVVPLIIQRGFNRSFCGKNATFYGKGVYFARDASYSAHPTYARPDSNDTQRIFLCRTLKGEVCKGVRDGIQPDVRVQSNGTLYDSTTNNLSDPIMWITYHDAQAYPEYIVEFRVSAYA